MDYRPRAITSAPKHHFFGYYDMRCWDPTGRRHLVLEVDFADRPPTGDDVATVGVVDLESADAFAPVSATRAWNFQQGAMLNWLGGTEATFVFNDRREGRFVCVAHEMASGDEEVVGPAVGAVSDDGRWGATLNFARIAVTRPGYGYAGLDDPRTDAAVPADDGVGLLDIARGSHRLILSFADLAGKQEPELDYGRTKVWFNHVVFNPSATRLALLCRFVRTGEPTWTTQMWTIGLDGADPVRCLDGPLISHFDWKDDETLIAWAGVDGVDAMFEVDHARRTSPKPVFTDAIRRDGHISYSPDRRWVVCDTYPDERGNRELFAVECATERKVSLGTYYSPRRPNLHEIRCDFHPSWRPDGRAIAFDGMHEGSRQRYCLEFQA